MIWKEVVGRISQEEDRKLVKLLINMMGNIQMIHSRVGINGLNIGVYHADGQQ